jgi:hypothetical protein
LIAAPDCGQTRAAQDQEAEKTSKVLAREMKEEGQTEEETLSFSASPNQGRPSGCQRITSNIRRLIILVTQGTTAALEWTFPPAFAEVIRGDGSRVARKRVDLGTEEAFSQKVLRCPVDLRGAKWVRLEAWDIAANGAFSQPVWIE